MKPNDLKINMRLEAAVRINQETEYVPVRIEEIGTGYMAVSMPMWQGLIIPLHSGEQLCLRIFHRYSYYGFETTIVERKVEPVPMLIIKRPEELQSLGQMRENVRIPISLALRFRQLTSNDNDFSPHEAFTSNISAGGALICTDVPLERGVKLWLELSLGKGEFVCCQAVVKRVSILKGSKPSGRVAVKYSDIEENDRERIARFIFSKQREFIKRGITET